MRVLDYAMLLRGADTPVTGAGRLTIEDGVITALEDDPAPIETVGAEPGHLLLPALANAHDHGRGLRALAFGARDDALEVWISELNLEPLTEPYVRAAVCFGRMAEAGIGAANHCHQYQANPDLFTEAEAVARAARDVGIRIAFAVPIQGRNPIAYGDPAALLAGLPPDEAEALAAAARAPLSWDAQLDAVERIAELAHDCFIVQYGPIAPQWVDDTALAEVARRSEATGRRVHMHLLETRLQREWGDATYPGGLVRHLDSIGLLSPRLTVAHGVWLSDDDCALLAERGVTVSVNTSSNLRLRSGTAPVERFVKHGLAFGVGVDGAAFDDDEDMLRELRLFWRMHRGLGPYDALARERLLQAVLVDGRASIVGEDKGGRVEVGAPADLLLLDMTPVASDILPGRVDPLDLLIARGTNRLVRDLYIGGRRVVADGRCQGVNLAAAEQELTRQARAAAGPYDRGRQERLTHAVANYYRCGCHLPGSLRSTGLS